MNLTISPINSQTTSSQNISSKGLFKKLFGASKKPAKDVFISTTAATVGTASIVAANQVQKSEKTDWDKATGRVFANLRNMSKLNSIGKE